MVVDMRTALLGQAALVGGAALAWYAHRSQQRFDPKRLGPAAALSASSVRGAAQDVVKATRAIGMVCCCAAGDDAPPSCRLMDIQFSSDDERMRLHLITKPWTRKAQQLGESSDRVTITFHDPRESGENGYAALSGSVRKLLESHERDAGWKPTWGFFHERSPDASTIWQFTPARCEVINHRKQ
eukprot:6626838-Prymnesium_polylepis.1